MLAGCGMYLGEGGFLNGKSLWRVIFLQELQGMMPDMEIEDSWVWKDEECLRYSVKSAYGFLRRGLEEENKFLYDKFWRCKALPLAQVTT